MVTNKRYNAKTMSVYRIIFVHNKILFVTQEEERTFPLENPVYYYKNSAGFLVYAIIKCATEEEALKTAQRIIVEESSQAGTCHIQDHSASYYEVIFPVPE